MQALQACASQVGNTQDQNTLYYNIRVLTGSYFCPPLNYSSCCLFLPSLYSNGKALVPSIVTKSPIMFKVKWKTAFDAIISRSQIWGLLVIWTSRTWIKESLNSFHSEKLFSFPREWKSTAQEAVLSKPPFINSFAESQRNKGSVVLLHGMASEQQEQMNSLRSKGSVFMQMFALIKNEEKDIENAG